MMCFTLNASRRGQRIIPTWFTWAGSGAVAFGLLLAVSLGVLPAVGSAQTAAPTESMAAHGLNAAFIDTTCSACQDLFQHANGLWLKTAQIPGEQSSWGNFEELFERNSASLRLILDSLRTAQEAPGTSEWKVGHLYASCMDSARIEADGGTPLREEIGRIESVATVPQLRAEVARLQGRGIGVLFTLLAAQDAKHSTQVIADASQGGIGLPERDYYFRTDSVSDRTRKEYEAHVARTLALSGVSEAASRAQAARVMALETELARASMTIVEQRDPSAIYHRMTVAELGGITPRWSWPSFFREVGRPDVANVNVQQPKFFKAVDSLLGVVPMADWKAYLRWQYTNAASTYLSSAFVKESFKLESLLNGTTELRPRWKRCGAWTDNLLGEALGKVYVTRYFPPRAKAKALELVQNLEGVLHDDLASLEWMSAATRQQALVKLAAFKNKIGYPDRWRDYSALTITDGPLWPNVVAANQFEVHRQLTKIARPVDRGEWGMTPPTIDAQYNPNLNDITFPAGILQPPFFDPDADDASNYGAIGVVIGHEMTHGFDDQGRQFDARGDLRDWWTAADASAYKARAQLVSDQFDHYVVVDTVKLNGQQTLGENIADLGGVKIAYAALERALRDKPRPAIDGMTPEQRFFIAYGQMWRAVFRPEALRLRAQVDVHSSAKWRVDGPVSNMPEFAKAFQCPAGSPEVRPDSLRAQIW